MSGISEQDESVTGGDGCGGGVAKKNKTMGNGAVLPGRKKNNKKNSTIQCSGHSGAELRVEVMFYTILSPLSFVFAHMDVISRNLSGFVD